MSTLGERIKKVRNDNHLTQFEFGKKLGVTQTHISKIEKDSENPSPTILMFICYLFCVNYQWLANGTEERELYVNSSEESDTVRLDKARLTLENNLKEWGTDISWEYVNSIEYLTNILSKYHPNIELNYEAQIEYYKTIASIINHIQVMTFDEDKIRKGMNGEDIYQILLHHYNLMQKIENDLKDLTKLIFKIHNIDIFQNPH